MRITYWLIAANVVAFVLQFLIAGFTEAFALTPATAVNGAYWQFLTYMFMHGGIGHIAINMFVLAIFGMHFESAIGSRRFLTLYLASGVFSAFFYLMLTGESFIPMLGASGAVFAIVTAFAFKFPNRVIFAFFVPMPAKYAVIMFTVLEFFSGVFDLQMGIANFGHLGGIIAGFLIMYYWRSRDRDRRAPEFQDIQFVWE
jgi:membrane associated rhomboid family serine protease